MSRFVLILLAPLYLAALLAANEVAPFPAPFNDETQGDDTGSIPGREKPASLADPVAVTFAWDKYITRVVIAPAEPGKSLRAPAWVVTYDQEGHVVVGYRATAFHDKKGLLHIDAHNAIVSGPQAFDVQGGKNWWADSFAIAPEGTLQSIDDQPDHEGHTGRVTETITDKATYRRLLMVAIAIVREMS